MSLRAERAGGRNLGMSSGCRHILSLVVNEVFSCLLSSILEH